MDDMTQTCGTCFYFEPYRDPDTKRIHKAKFGKCGWKVNEKFNWPLAYVRSAGTNPLYWLQPVPVLDITDAKTCHWYTRKS